MFDHQDNIGECFQKSKVTITCNCRQWYMRTCIIITVFGVCVICWCVYCTILIVRLTQELDDLRQSRDRVRHVNIPSNGVNSYPAPEVGLGDLGVVDSHLYVERTLIHQRVKRSKKDNQKSTKMRKEKKEKKKKTLKSAHFIPRSGLQPQHEHNYNSTIEVFRLAPWWVTTDSPFTVAEHGKFRVDYTGTYLIYAQVLYKHALPFASLGVVQHRPDTPRDMLQSIYCRQEIPTGQGRQLSNTCTLTALFQLQKDDYITLENFYIDPEITYSVNSTYFGAVLLS
ncbi:uncharacterized protein LOC127835306 [Dreissena polymorpha]|uniref:THD domain-containing protein n=1 Tax=Dreissena polymorpha TaxID=45954 RepID=A0A9D4FX71_DREPO|nr:uncharacterized protein LOC127835306 [Dreissena polymorpha]KAH3804746.1 hypothetical protein DPMN_133035 [Dreissena polymorpha]